MFMNKEQYKYFLTRTSIKKLPAVHDVMKTGKWQ